MTEKRDRAKAEWKKLGGMDRKDHEVLVDADDYETKLHENKSRVNELERMVKTLEMDKVLLKKKLESMTEKRDRAKADLEELNGMEE
ncbi:hypothetical protein BGZ47_005297 [Haplosporangium gracile]|nr:hypothetical protein BGZ47_005297 [Haplosporangium gracile]